jgi:hypothetical protein
VPDGGGAQPTHSRGKVIGRDDAPPAPISGARFGFAASSALRYWPGVVRPVLPPYSAARA